MNIIYSTRDVIRIFGIHRNTITKMVKDGRLKTISGTEHKPYYFSKTTLQKLLLRLRSSRYADKYAEVTL